MKDINAIKETSAPTPTEHYRKRVAEAESKLKRIKQQIIRISALRVLLFVAGIAGIVVFFHAGSWKIIVSIGCTFVPFFVLVKWHNRLFHRKEWMETQRRVNHEELQALAGNNEAFDDGSEYIDPEHLYSFDLDVFGRRSLFQAMNRTCTFVGKKRLAAMMQQHLRDKASIERRQEAVKEVAMRTGFREQFRVAGIVYRGQASDSNELRQWIETPCALIHAAWTKVATIGVPTVNALLLVAGLAGLISFTWFGVAFMCFVILSFGVVKRATAIQEAYGKKLKTLGSYARLIALVKGEAWHAEAMRELMERLDVGGKSPVEALQKLSKELDRLDLRNNQLLYFLLEGSLFFQLQQIIRIERWKERYGNHVMQWLDTVGDIDALCSLGTFAYNHPDYIFPTIADRPFIFEARQMKHPSMPAEQCVPNDADIPSRPFFLIITGANMAGKSTYLRTIGVNYLLGCIGAPVSCASLTLYPAQLVTSLRTSDSLSDNESYFFAELKRLKRIIDLLDSGEELFIILDEILKGTNSMDKQKGSLNLIRQFLRLKANGIIATHDLLLGKLIEQFPEAIRNYCFEADIRNDELSFSYRLRKGVAQNMNACFLMKKMGIVMEE